MEDQERLQLLLKRFKEYAAGHYFDVSRDNLEDSIRSICENTIQTKDYIKFSSAVANVLFNKVYISAEVWNPNMVSGLIDILADIKVKEEVSSKFSPATAMLGEQNNDDNQLRDMIIEHFNSNVDKSDIEEIKGLKIQH